MSADINCTGDSKRTHSTQNNTTHNRQTITTNHDYHHRRCRKKCRFLSPILPINEILFIFSFRSRKFSLLITYVFYRVVYDKEQKKVCSVWCGAVWYTYAALNSKYYLQL